MDTPILQYTAFSTDPDGGNPAGVVPDARGLDEAAMQAIARRLGHSETAFLVPHGEGRFDVRYFSPEAEVPFCGHATIASAVAIADRDGPGALRFDTRAGRVDVETGRNAAGAHATLTSVAPRVEPAPDGLVDRALAALGWSRAELDAALPPRIAFAGARHLVLAAATRDRLARLDYDFDALRALMLAHDLTTVALVQRESATRYHVRNPFPVGGVVEDPATGAAAAAFGAYLRERGLAHPPAEIELHQGDDMGRPSRLHVSIGSAPGIRVRGHAVRMGD
ncbi:PhzF family phenazine biosynthesis protein [Lysobacter humi (ex Lee et al. 2017)]